LTRGTTTNIAYVFTTSPKIADPAPGPRPAPQLARYDRQITTPGHQPAPAPGPEDALSVLSGVLDRDGPLLSATQTRNQALSDADHLVVLHAIWTAETTPACHQWIKDLAAARRAFADRLADRQSMRIPFQDPDYGYLGPAFPAWPAA
jgi:hypothetical protein